MDTYRIPKNQLCSTKIDYWEKSIEKTGILILDLDTYDTTEIKSHFEIA